VSEISAVGKLIQEKEEYIRYTVDEYNMHWQRRVDELQAMREKELNRSLTAHEIDRLHEDTRIWMDSFIETIEDCLTKNKPLANAILDGLLHHELKKNMICCNTMRLLMIRMVIERKLLIPLGIQYQQLFERWIELNKQEELKA
jgi:hypothetical protein